MTAEYFVVGNGTVNVKISSMRPSTSSTTWSTTSDVYVPTMKAISSYVTGLGYTSVTESTVSGWGFTKNAGTVTQVKVGTTAYDPSSGIVSLPAYPTKSSWNYDDKYVALTGDQTISGKKTFNDDIISKGYLALTGSAATDASALSSGTNGNLLINLTHNTGSSYTYYILENANNGNTYHIATQEWAQAKLPTTTTAGKVLKSTSTAGTVEWADDTDTNTWRNVKVDGTEKLGTATSTGALDFLSQNTNNGDVSFTYDSTNKGIKATAKVPTSFNITVTDDILDGTGGANSVKYTPYSSKGAGHLYTGTTNPSSTNRLNYDGYFYATKLYSGGSEVLTGHQSIKNLDTTATTSQSISASEAIVGSGTIILHKVSKTGKYTDLLDTPTIGNGTLTVQNNGTTVNTFTANSTADKTVNILTPRILRYI